MVKQRAEAERDDAGSSTALRRAAAAPRFRARQVMATWEDAPPHDNLDINHRN